MPHTIPRKTTLVRCRRATSVRGGWIVDVGQVAEVDVEDVGPHLTSGCFELAPSDAIADVTAQLLPEVLAPPAPVKLRWISQVSSRQFDGVSVHAGDLFEVAPEMAATLLEDRVAEVVVPAPADD